MSPAVRKPRRKSDGSYEIQVPCDVCGSQKCEYNSTSGLRHCWTCGASGRRVQGVLDTTGISFLSAKDGPPGASLPSPASPGALEDELQLTDKFPIFALQECVRRRQEPQWLVKRYRARWSYAENRLWFPAGDGGVLRSVLSWEDPKTKCVVGPSCVKGLIGEHLLQDVGCPKLTEPMPMSGAVVGEERKTLQGPPRLVLVEGDWKCLSIPVPWIGLGLQGTQLSESQRFKILCSDPLSVTVMLDGGFVRESQRIVESLLPFRAVRVDLPGVTGPDDIPRAELVRLLLEQERK